MSEIEVFEYGVIDLEPDLHLYVYFSEDRSYVKCNDLNKVVGLSTRSAYGQKVGACMITGLKPVSVACLSGIHETLYPSLSADRASKVRLDRVFEVLGRVDRHPISELREPVSGSDPSSALEVPKVFQLPEYPNFGDISEAEIFSDNTRTYLRVRQELKSVTSKVLEVDHSISALPSGVETIEDIRLILRLTYDLWVSTLLYKHVSDRFVSDPVSPISLPVVPEVSKEVSDDSLGSIGLPLHPAVLDGFEGPDDAIKREYDLLVSYLVSLTSDDYGKVKHIGYEALASDHGLVLTVDGKKPVEVISDRGWWKEQYRSLWSAYSTVLRHIGVPGA